jgi:hypothetical protein
LPEIGQEIYAEGESAYAGKILTTVINPAGKVEALAVMKIALVDKNLRLNKSEIAEQDSITLLDLPYSVE